MSPSATDEYLRSRCDGPKPQREKSTGRVLAPGFIDIHTHSDFTLPLNRLAEA